PKPPAPLVQPHKSPEKSRCVVRTHFQKELGEITMVVTRRTQISLLLRLPWIFVLALFAGAVPAARGADKNYCVNVDYSAVPAQCNYEKITLIVNVGTCASVAVTADGAAVSATYSSSTGTATFTTTGKSIVVTAQNWTAGGTGAATKATLYNNFHWSYSL